VTGSLLGRAMACSSMDSHLPRFSTSFRPVVVQGFSGAIAVVANGHGGKERLRSTTAAAAPDLPSAAASGAVAGAAVVAAAAAEAADMLRETGADGECQHRAEDMIGVMKYSRRRIAVYDRSKGSTKREKVFVSLTATARAGICQRGLYLSDMALDALAGPSLRT
jgi:hypothetical protein